MTSNRHKRSGGLSGRVILASLIGLAGFSSVANADQVYQAWTQEFDTTATSVSQGARAVCTDDRGNTFATGYAEDGAANPRFYTVKYDALDGHIVWAKFYAPGGDAPYSSTSSPMSIACDSQGNAIVTSSQNVGNIDVVTIKYRASDGAVLWTKIYDGTAGGQDEGVKVAVDGNDDVVVTAKSGGSGTAYDIVTIKYASSNGAPLWANPDRYNATNRDDVPTDLAIDGSNNIIVVGDVLTASGEHSFYIRKLNTNGVFQWSKTLNTGLDGGATGVALNSIGTVFATGLYTDNSSHHGYYTVAYSSSGTLRWGIFIPPSANSSDFTGKPTDIAVGPDGNPVVTGYLQDDQGTEHAYTVKYDDADNGSTVGFYDYGLVDPKTGEAFGDTRGKGVVVDGANNIIIVGESDPANFSPDLFVTKYSADLSTRQFFDTYNGTKDATDRAYDIALDGNGGFAIAAEPTRKSSTGIGYGEFFVRKYNRFLAYTGDQLTETAKYSTGSAPALADNGTVAAGIKVAVGTKKLGAIFTQNVSGGTTLPAVQGGDAPNITGAKFASFSDPIVSPDGHYAFAGKVTGVVASQASGVWTNLGGTLHLALQKGKPVPGMGLTDNLSSAMSLSLRNARLVALVKVTAPATSNVALVSIDSANTGTVLLRTGQSVTVGALPTTTVKKLTVLSPAKASPGDGRWHGDSHTAVLATLADKRTVIYHITAAGGLSVDLFTGGDASVVNAGSTWKTLGLPAYNSLRIAALGSVTGGTSTATTDTAIVHSFNGGAFAKVAAEGGTPTDATLNALTYAGFTDPIVSPTGSVAFLATLKGSGVTPANNRALLYGPFNGTHAKIARTGDKATDSAGVQGTATWSSFTSFALGGSTPIFVAKLSGSGVTAKNNLGIWSRDSASKVRRILRTGDVLGDVTVKSFTLLKPVSTAPSAARSFNSGGSITALVSFTNGKQALVKLSLP